MLYCFSSYVHDCMTGLPVVAVLEVELLESGNNKNSREIVRRCHSNAEGYYITYLDIKNDSEASNHVAVIRVLEDDHHAGENPRPILAEIDERQDYTFGDNCDTIDATASEDMGPGTPFCGRMYPMRHHYFSVSSSAEKDHFKIERNFTVLVRLPETGDDDDELPTLRSLGQISHDLLQDYWKHGIRNCVLQDDSTTAVPQHHLFEAADPASSTKIPFFFDCFDDGQFILMMLLTIRTVAPNILAMIMIVTIGTLAMLYCCAGKKCDAPPGEGGQQMICMLQPVNSNNDVGSDAPPPDEGNNNKIQLPNFESTSCEYINNTMV